jgi:hypothetical protein
MNNAQVSGRFNVDSSSPPTLDWQIQGLGDFNGDGTTDVLWRNNNGQVHIWTMNNAQVSGRFNVDSSAPPTLDWKIQGVGDFNGDGTTDVLWRNNNGQVHIWTMNNAQVSGRFNVDSSAPPTLDWQIQGVGDFNGDRTTDVLWRNNNGQVHIWTMNNAQVSGRFNVDSSAPPTLDWQIQGKGNVNSTLYGLPTSAAAANQFFKQQFQSSTYNPDGPRSSQNCGPASLAMILKTLGLEQQGISVETSIDHARYLMYPNDSRVTTTKQGIKVLDADGETTGDSNIQNGIKNAGGTGTESYTWNALDQNLSNGKPMVARGNITDKWRSQFPSSSRYGTGGDSHFIAILGKTSDGKYIVADPMYRDGAVAMTKDQLSVFFQFTGPVTISF